MEKSTVKKFLAAWMSVAGLAPIGVAQSGRGTQRPAPAQPATAAETVEDYSESVPSRNGRLVVPAKNADAPGKASGEKPPQKNAKHVDSGTVTAGEGVIKIETDLITVPVSVFDRNGLYISDLQRSDFRIFEDGVEQEIAYFGTSEKPFTVVLLLDTSLSTNYKIEEIRRAAMAFVGQLRSHDAVAVIEFDRDVNVLTEATHDRSRIEKAISRADFGYGTSLYDAVYFCLRKRLNKIEGRKAIVLFTDGVDTTSERAGYDTTLLIAEESDAMVFPIYYNTFDWNNGSSGGPVPALANSSGTSAEEYALGRKYLAELAEYTGGRVFRPEATPGGLTAAFEGIAEELRRQYNIGYVPADPGKPGQRKHIRVRVNRRNLVIRARDNYIVGVSKTPSLR